MRMAEQPATERQIAYATNLGLEFPADINIDEMSDLIDFCKSRGTRPEAQLFEWAERLRIPVTRYTSQERLLDKVFDCLCARVSEHDLIAWFACFVAREIMPRRKDLGSPFAPVVQQVASSLIGDAKVIASIRRYSGVSLIHLGDSRSLAYKTVSQCLKVAVQGESPQPRRDSKASNNSQIQRTAEQAEKLERQLQNLISVLSVERDGLHRCLLFIRSAPLRFDAWLKNSLGEENTIILAFLRFAIITTLLLAAGFTLWHFFASPTAP